MLEASQGNSGYMKNIDSIKVLSRLWSIFGSL